MFSKRKTVLLCALIGAALLSACGQTETADPANTEEADTEVTTAAVTENPYDPGLPEADFGGYEFTFLQFCVPEYAYKLQVDLVATEENGDTLNDAVYRRNTALEDAYNSKSLLYTVPNGILSARTPSRR